MDKGLIIEGQTNTITLHPPLTIKKVTLQKMLEILKESIKEVEREVI